MQVIDYFPTKPTKFGGGIPNGMDGYTHLYALAIRAVIALSTQAGQVKGVIDSILLCVYICVYIEWNWRMTSVDSCSLVCVGRRTGGDYENKHPKGFT